jgi:hypothetical protein
MAWHKEMKKAGVTRLFYRPKRALFKLVFDGCCSAELANARPSLK